MRHISVDIETRSGVDIKKAGAFRYALDPDFRILLIAYKVDDNPTRIIDMTDPDADLGISVLREVLNNSEYVKHAYNAAFEWWCFKQAGFLSPLDQWDDTMARVQYCGYPSSLEAAGAALGLPADKQKLSIGKALIKHFCVPQTGLVRWNEPAQDPERWELFKEYCMQDVETEHEIAKRLAAFPIPDEEMDMWRSTTRMNAYGVRADLHFASQAIAINAACTEDLIEEAKSLTGLKNPNSNVQLIKWLNSEGVEVDNMRAETVEELLKRSDLPAVARRVLEIKQKTGKSSLAKYDTIFEVACEDHRLRGLSRYYGAGRTGRFSGALLQPQNLPRVYIHDLETPRHAVLSGNVEYLDMLYDNIPDILSQLIRTALISSEGCTFQVADFSAIEARVIAWLAGEKWVNEVFATHGKIYEATAAQMFKVPIETIVKGHPNYNYRQRGKVATLALGYQGGPAALIAMGALSGGIPEEELPEIVDRWRETNPHIVNLWYDAEQAALWAVAGRGDQRTHDLIFRLEGDLLYGYTFLTIELPSGRKLYYPQPTLKVNTKGRKALHYMSASGASGKWTEKSTYGGKLVENIVQAIARDCLCEVLRRVEVRGHQVVFHVHDEIIVDAPDGSLTVDELCRIMAEPIAWAPGLILKGAGFSSPYYKKD